MKFPVVRLRDGTRFESPPNTTILDAAMNQGVTLDYSCRNGRCGECRARVSGDSTTPIQAEICLTENEKSEGWILTCCRQAIADIHLDLENLYQLADIQIKTLPCRVSDLRRAVDDIALVELRLPPTSDFRFVAGQYINVIGPQGIRRSYSLANAPRSDGRLELHIREVAEGSFSRYWFNEARINDLLRFEGPLGTFFLRDNEARQIIFLATGTGIAPVKALLEQMNADPDRWASRSVKVFWGARTPEEFYWSPRSDKLNLEWVPVLSRAHPQWQGAQGYVQDYFLSRCESLEGTLVYASGSETMIQSTRAALERKGFEMGNFHSDAFVSTA